jgi:hypothetical protein
LVFSGLIESLEAPLPLRVFMVPQVPKKVSRGIRGEKALPPLIVPAIDTGRMFVIDQAQAKTPVKTYNFAAGAP